MLGAVVIIAAIYYFLKGRHDYQGPMVNVKREE